LRFWLSALRLSPSIELAPYDQVFQELLRPDSALSRGGGIGVVLVRLEGWLATDSNGRGGSRVGDFEAVVTDLAQAVATARGRASSPLIVCFCPPTGVSSNSADAALLAAAEARLAEDFSARPGVEVVRSDSFQSLYAMETYGFDQGQRIANIPYTEAFFAVLGTVLARRMYSMLCPAHKVLVLDCDDTLWGGLCGELGSSGVDVAQGHLELQAFAIEQQRAGKLVCLASRNNEEDVLSVFDDNPSMLLAREHLTAWEVNWGRKSDSIERLSQKLGLGLDSFIFIDDDPVQCAEVAGRFPEVLTFTLPKADVGRFCRHIWPLDRSHETELSQRRTSAYREHLEREDVRTQSMSFEDFIKNLELEVSITSLGDADLRRAVELTQRTNQFNLSGLKLAEAELRDWMANPAMHCRAVRVRDRFGDYGLVGLIFSELADDTMRVPVFLLSCRALGRGVEHRMLAHVGDIAQQNGLPLALKFKRTSKNTPAFEFLQHMATFNLRLDEETEVSINSHAAATARLDSGASPAVETHRANRPGEALVASLAERNEFLRSIPAAYWSADTIVKAIGGQASAHASTEAAADPVEAMLIAAFARELDVEEVGIDDSFFELGGHSLQAVMILAQASDQFGVELDPTLLFTTSFSIAELSQEIGFLRASDKKDMAGILDQLSAITDSESG
jgi:FkbH-like protein